MQLITLLLVDDHTLVRHALRQELEQVGDLTVIAEAGSLDQALEQTRRHRSQVALVDVELPDSSGIEKVS